MLTRSSVPYAPDSPGKPESLSLEIDKPTPILILPPFGTSFLLPQNVGALPKMLVESAMPVLFRTPFRASLFLPKQIGAFPNSLLQTKFRFRISLQIIAVGSHLTAPARVHPGSQGSEFSVRHKPTVRCRFQRLGQVCRVVGVARLAQGDRVRVQHSAAAVYYVNQSLGHDCLPGIFRGDVGAKPSFAPALHRLAEPTAAGTP